jgi:hypothetical protein
MKPTLRPSRPAAPEPVPAAFAVPVALLAAVLIALGVSFRMDDPDIWQHLTVGKAIWQLHRIPHENLWTWPSYGEPYLLPSWLFRALLWPVWQAGGEWGLAAWRWGFTLGTFAIGWFTARRLGARGLAPFVAIVWCAIASRQRSMVRPEMLAGLLLATELWMLERRRGGDRRIVWGLVPLAWVWINAHISYTLFFEVGLAYLVHDWVHRREPGVDPRALVFALALALAACFANPFGAAALWQPFDYVLHQRNEPIFLSIGELHGIPWHDHLRSGLPLLLVLIPQLAFARWRRRFDVAQLALYAIFIPQAISSVRFLGPLMIVAAPFFARDLASALEAFRMFAWARRPALRATFAAACCLLVAVPELLRPTAPIGIGFNQRVYPRAACDWIERMGVRGRSFNPFDKGGYLLWRFWPQRDRLPFMDIHQTGTRRDRDRMAFLFGRQEAWTEMESEHRFDWVLLVREQDALSHTVEYVAADTSFTPAFLDDDWVVFLRRDGPMAALAKRSSYHLLPASYRGMNALGDSVMANPALRGPLRAELERSIRESPRSGHAHSLLANLAMLEGRWAEAVAELKLARAIDRSIPGLDARQNVAEDSLGTGHPR